MHGFWTRGTDGYWARGCDPVLFLSRLSLILGSQTSPMREIPHGLRAGPITFLT
uniref:Uncharacterized protein n=1 Tax=Arundo donax TaxID=35708 RepID=A0A0A9HCL5_ARUDO